MSQAHFNHGSEANGTPNFLGDAVVWPLKFGGSMDPRALRQNFLAGLIAELRVVWPILSVLLGLMMTLGLVIGVREGWSVQDSIYFAFVSGLTIGYGDLAPKVLLTRVLAILIGLVPLLIIDPAAGAALISKAVGR